MYSHDNHNSLLNKERKKNLSIPYDRTRLKRNMIKTGLQHWGVCFSPLHSLCEIPRYYYLFSGQAS